MPTEFLRPYEDDEDEVTGVPMSDPDAVPSDKLAANDCECTDLRGAIKAMARAVNADPDCRHKVLDYLLSVSLLQTSLAAQTKYLLAVEALQRTKREGGDS